MERLFLQHPRARGETYVEHQAAALEVAWTLLGAAGACFVHALVPSLFETTASRVIARLHNRLGRRGVRPPAPVGSTELLEYQI